MEKLCRIDGIRWVRFLYAYPESITNELIDVVAKEDKICKYFDIPIQHFSDDILKKMNRKTTGQDIVNIISKIRSKIPNVILRTSLIVGFPGETESDFEILKNCVSSLKFDRLGCFSYSKEDGTPAAKFDNQIHYSTKEKRNRVIMELQKGISDESLASKVGNVYEVLIENLSDDGAFFEGRTYMDSPDTDGIILVANNGEELLNRFVKCKIVGYEGYDLIAEVV